MKVFIDGENLRHRLVSVLYSEHLLHDRDDLFKFDVRRLIESAVGDKPESISYYTTRIVQPDFEIPELLAKKIDHIMGAHRRWVSMLTNQNITVVKAGNLKVKESNACYHCGRRTMVLHEKGVDVRLAAEIVVAAVHEGAKEVGIISSDADMIPALEIAKGGGAKIIYITFEEEITDAMTKIADKVVIYSRQQIVDSFLGLVTDTAHGEAPDREELAEVRARTEKAEKEAVNAVKASRAAK
jgi:uncharacterized LabA/DUF88 family protein